MCLDYIFDGDELGKMASRYAEQYVSARPFPHVVIDDFLPTNVLEKVLDEFPEPNDIEWVRYEREGYEKHKRESKVEGDLPSFTRFLLYQFNSSPFLEFLEALTGIEGLIPDPYFSGGGLHQVGNGGYLKIHADFSLHPTFGISRRINVLVYLNKDWQDSYGGQLELWNSDMSSCEARVLPIFNRCVIFNTTADSFHGHPDPITCPEDVTRRSIALYYYAKEDPEDRVRSTTEFMFRPDEKPIVNFRTRVSRFIPPVILDTRRRLLDYLKTRNGRRHS